MGVCAPGKANDTGAVEEDENSTREIVGGDVKVVKFGEGKGGIREFAGN